MSVPKPEDEYTNTIFGDGKISATHMPYLRMIVSRASVTEMADRLVANYMLVRAHSESLAAFLKESKFLSQNHFSQLRFKDNQKGFKYMKIRREVCESIEEGKSNKARSMINLHFDSLVEKSSQLKFIITFQEFLDRTLVPNFDHQEALKFARDNLSEYLNSRDSRETLICDALTLLAFSEPGQCPCSYLKSQKRRDDAARMVSFRLMQEIERLAMIDAGLDDIEVEEVPDSNLLTSYNASFALISHIGLMEKVQQKIAKPTFVAIQSFSRFSLIGDPTKEIQEEIDSFMHDNRRPIWRQHY
ncbi:hypothetical protein ACOME3_005655 [Neoechinorhynchus agilis]